MTANSTSRPPPNIHGGAGCLVCGLNGLSASRLPGLLRCRQCGFVTADLRLDSAELLRLYGPDYFHGQEYGDYQAERASLHINFKRRLGELMAMAGNARSLFEIGCAYGFFLELAKPLFDRVAGIDLSPEVVGKARTLGLDVTAGDFLATETGSHDIYCLWDTIEHLDRPDLFLEKIARDISPGGLVAITTGDISSLNARWRGKRWRMIHPPTHLHYFSAATLTALLERLGFKVVHLSHPGTARSLRAIAHGILVLTLKMPGFYKLIEQLLPPSLAVTLNLGDIMFVVARKEQA